jgi:hypothetical protein
MRNPASRHWVFLGVEWLLRGGWTGQARNNMRPIVLSLNRQGSGNIAEFYRDGIVSSKARRTVGIQSAYRNRQTVNVYQFSRHNALSL